MALKRLLTAAEILAVKDVKTTEVELPDWDGTVLLKNLTAAEANEFSEQAKKGDKDAGLRLVVASVVDEEGKRVFCDADLPLLREKALRPLLAIQNRVLELNGLRDEKAVTGAATAAKND